MQNARVLHVISGIDPENGGPTTALLGLSKAQVRAGMSVSVLATWQRPTAPAHAEAFRSAGVDVAMVGPAKGRLSRHPQLAQVVGEQVVRHDVVHIHGLWEQVQHTAAAACRRRRVPYVFTPHGMLDPWSLGHSRWAKRLYLAWRLRADLDAAAALHYTAEPERQAAAPLGLMPPVILEPNGVDFDEFDQLPQRGRFRAKYPQLRDRPILLFLGRIDHKKGLDLLVPAFAQGGNASSVLVLAGPDNTGYGDVLRPMVARLGLADRVLFTGMLHGRDRIEALVDADLFATTSYVENFGIAIVEALAAGLPVIISDRVNIAADIAGAGVGEVVPTDVATIAAALARWQSDPAHRATAAAAAPAFARERYDWLRIAERWGAHYRRPTGAVAAGGRTAG